jgi:hypothetical protein
MMNLGKGRPNVEQSGLQLGLQLYSISSETKLAGDLVWNMMYSTGFLWKSPGE